MIKILIADDHAIVRRGLKDILLEEFPAAQICEVADAESLVAEVRKHAWDIVITDLTMPGRSGLEALQDIKGINAKLPVLILSAHSEDHYALRVLKAGASGYLMKESAPDELVIAVQRALLGKKYITPAIAEKLASAFDINSKILPHETLSDREFEVFKMLASGKSVSEIGYILFLSTSTVSTYRARILTKMDINTNAGLTQYAMENKII
jgi:DNA-binding NarL/FixJ family response regulator